MAVIFWAFCLIGCTSPPPAAPITEDKALAMATDILRGRKAMPKEYEQTVAWATNHWSISIQEIERDESGQRIQTMWNHPRLVYLYPDGKLLAILEGGKATREETAQWEDNLRKLLATE